MTDNLDVEREKRKKSFLDRFGEDSPYAIVLLKGHLLVEEVLEEIIVSACRDPEPVYEARMSFFTKAKLAQAIDAQSPGPWRAIERLNTARNELAHGRDVAVLEQKIDAFIDCAKSTYNSNSWQDDRLFNLELSIVLVHAAVSRIAADRVHA